MRGNFWCVAAGAALILAASCATDTAADKAAGENGAKSARGLGRGPREDRDGSRSHSGRNAVGRFRQPQVL